MLTKPDLRRRFRSLRDAATQVDRTAWSDRIRQRVLALPEVQAASSVFVYASQGSEVQTYTLIEALLAMGKTVAVPRIVDRAAARMQAVAITSLKDLAPVPRHYDLLEPPADVLPLQDSPAITVLPCLAACPATGHRLGTGGGYYDRFLQAHPDTLPILLAFDIQLADPLPADPHDQPARLVITEAALVHIDPDPTLI